MVYLTRGVKVGLMYGYDSFDWLLYSFDFLLDLAEVMAADVALDTNISMHAVQYFKDIYPSRASCGKGRRHKLDRVPHYSSQSFSNAPIITISVIFIFIIIVIVQFISISL